MLCRTFGKNVFGDKQDLRAMNGILKECIAAVDALTHVASHDKRMKVAALKCK